MKKKFVLLVLVFAVVLAGLSFGPVSAAATGNGERQFESGAGVVSLDDASSFMPDTSGISVDGKAGKIASKIVAKVNAKRASVGRAALTSNSILKSVAKAHSLDMDTRNFFDHVNPDGHDPGWRIAHAGYSCSWWGENIAYIGATSSASGTADQIASRFVKMWWNSPGHKANMINSQFTQTGVGVVWGNCGYGNGWIATQVFARPA